MRVAGSLTVDPGLCGTCLHARVVRSDRGSVFYRCGLSDGDPQFPKYPRLPVIECAGWKRADYDKLEVSVKERD
jgi:hypothetical protein